MAAPGSAKCSSVKLDRTIVERPRGEGISVGAQVDERELDRGRGAVCSAAWMSAPTTSRRSAAERAQVRHPPAAGIEDGHRSTARLGAW